MDNEISTAVSSVTTAMAAQINLATIGGIVAAVIGAGLSLFVGWFAIRKVIGAVKGALRGKLRV